MPDLTMPNGTPEEKLAWIKGLSLDDLREFTTSQPPCRCTGGGHCLTEFLGKLILEKEHYAYHLQDDCPICQHQRHIVEGCYLCKKEDRYG